MSALEETQRKAFVYIYTIFYSTSIYLVAAEVEYSHESFLWYIYFAHGLHPLLALGLLL